MLEALTPGPGILVCLAIQMGLRLGQHCLRENMKWVPAGFAAAIQTMPSQIMLLPVLAEHWTHFGIYVRLSLMDHTQILCHVGHLE